LTQLLVLFGQTIIPLGHSHTPLIVTRPPSHFLHVPSYDAPVPFGHLHSPLTGTLPPWHFSHVPFASTLPDGQLQLGCVPTMPPVHLRATHALAPSSQSCQSGHVQLGGVPSVPAGQGS
jgi:hypothetical protein